MSITPSDLAALSHLFDEALACEPAGLERWLADVAATYPHLIEPLRDMLDEDRTRAHSSFLRDGPRLAGGARDATLATVGDRLGPYVLVRELGRGGMASVWLAERHDGSSKRTVALKMPLATLQRERDIERFERERDLLGRLRHPRIAHLYDAGVTSSGQPYIVLEYVSGLPITEACNKRGLDIPARLRLFLDAMSALAHAHRHLVVHRDIKPSNVFVDDEGQVKLLDFGIAKLLQAADGTTGPTPLTQDGGNVLTPQYAAPEQMDGKLISTATDIYSLGALLYELLTGTLPHGGTRGSLAEWVQAVLNVEPARPSEAGFTDAMASQRSAPSQARLRALLAGDLDTIVMKALRKSPEERYGSVEAFAEDIRRFLDHRPIAARPASLAYRARLFIRRSRNAVVATALGAVVALLLGTAAYQQHLQKTAERARADAVRDFMFDLIGDAEPDETQTSAEVTGKQIVDNAVQRARIQFERQPELRGELLGELGRLYDKLGQEDHAAQLLDESIALLENLRPNDDLALNDTRASRATNAFGLGDVAKAKTLAQKAFTACLNGSVECERIRGYTTNVLAKIAAREGDVKPAIDLMKASVAHTELGFGKRHRETSSALVVLAVMQRNAGRLMDADANLKRALDIAEGLQLRAADRVDLLRSTAVIDIDMGRYETARHRLNDLLTKPLRRSDRMSTLRQLADAELMQGLPQQALAHAQAGLALTDENDARSNRIPFLRQARARAEALLEQPAAALADIDAVVAGLAMAGYRPNSLEQLRARRFRAEILARSGQLDAALQALEPLVAEHDSLAAPFDVEFGQTLDLLGTVKRARGNAVEAAASNTRAHALFVRALTSDHPMLVRNALYAAVVQNDIAPSVETQRRLKTLRTQYAQQAGAGSRWREMLDTPDTACTLRAPQRCALIF